MTDDSLSDEDKALFRESMRSVKPLKESASKNSDKSPPTKAPIKKERSIQLNKQEKQYFLSDFISDSVHSHSVLSYSQASLPTKRFKALKNGQIEWEARLDLHGLHAEAAKVALCHFINTQTANNKRCLLIIHGKGGQEGAPPIIKNLVNRWLPQIEEILAFHSALAKDGGHGAVYVLLKRTRF